MVPIEPWGFDGLITPYVSPSQFETAVITRLSSQATPEDRLQVVCREARHFSKSKNPVIDNCFSAPVLGLTL